MELICLEEYHLLIPNKTTPCVFLKTQGVVISHSRHFAKYYKFVCEADTELLHYYLLLQNSKDFFSEE